MNLNGKQNKSFVVLQFGNLWWKFNLFNPTCRQFFVVITIFVFNPLNHLKNIKIRKAALKIVD